MQESLDASLVRMRTTDGRVVGAGFLVGERNEPPPLPLPYSYRGHTGDVTSVAWSPDGKCLASASADHTVQVWDASSGTTLLTYTRHTGIVESVARSPGGKRLASASDDQTVWLWLEG